MAPWYGWLLTTNKARDKGTAHLYKEDAQGQAQTVCGARPFAGAGPADIDDEIHACGRVR